MKSTKGAAQKNAGRLSRVVHIETGEIQPHVDQVVLDTVDVAAQEV